MFADNIPSVARPELLSHKVQALPASGIRRFFDIIASMDDCISLGVGEPDFTTPQAFSDAAFRAVRDGHTSYTSNYGIMDLRKAIAAHLERLYGVRYDPTNEIVVTTGVSEALLLATLAILDNGDEVLCPDPYFVIYKHLVRLFGGRPVFYDTYPDFRLRGEEIEALITPRTKIIIVSSPSNPTGAVHSKDELEEIARIARKHNIFVISDEIYALFSYDGPHLSMATFTDRCLLLGGFSKSHSLTGWRLGYALGPTELIEEMTKLQQFTFVCAPSFAQEGALAAMEVDTSERRDDYRRKRDFIYNGLRKLGYRVEKPGGAFYIFPEVPWGTDEEFVGEAIRQKLLIIPGSIFSERKTHFRISYAAEDETLQRGLEVFERLFEDRRQS